MKKKASDNQEADSGQSVSVDCKFCLNQIPAGARKCHHCREWQHETMAENFSQLSAKVDQKTIDAGLPPASFQSKLAALCPRVNYWIFYMSLSIVFYASISLYWTYSSEDRIFLVSFFLNSLQMFFSSAGIVWFEKLLDRFRHEIPVITGWSKADSEEYYLRARRGIFAPGWPVIWGLAVCTVAVIGDNFVIGVPFKSASAAIAYSLYEFGFLFWSASAIVYFIKFAMFIREFGNNELRILIIQEEDSGIKLLGRFILQTTLFAVIPYVFSITARHIGGWNFSPLLLLWFSLFGISILFYLFWPIYNIHKAMIREKDSKLNLISSQLNALLSSRQLEPGTIQQIRYLMEIRAHLHDTNTWPFDMNKVIGLLSALVIPLASIVIDRALKGPPIE